jgi:hypothetical protein
MGGQGKNAQDRGADGKYCKSLTVRWAGATPLRRRVASHGALGRMTRMGTNRRSWRPGVSYRGLGKSVS